MRALVFGTDGTFVAPLVFSALHDGGWEVIEPADEIELLAIARDGEHDLIAIRTSRETAAMVDLARRIRQLDARVALFFVVDACDGAMALAAMRAGVNDLLTGCSSAEEIADAFGRVPRHGDVPPPRTELTAGGRMVGHSRSIEQLRRAIQRVATCDSNVLITGETGTGKELAAELIHCNSRRRDRPFVSLNCAAIPEGLLESELFGHERGAFTGAHAAREGKLQYAQGGTLFLDEVGDMSLYAQAKILRAIESRKVQRLGGNRELAVNIRIIAATNQNLEQLTSQQKFRQDLFFRLNVARLHIAPLRERLEDVPDLVMHMLVELAQRADRRIDEVDASFLEPLQRYAWPGNIRELRNVVESTIVFGSSHRITRRDLPPYLRALFASEERKQASEREKILGALRAAGWNRNEAARLLGCSRMTLYRKMVKYELFVTTSAAGARDVTMGA
ncbi:MAG TPA: sigma-54 dependent transcriptional regulator [Thermoanaerobaculia bacterium]|nr:sigma-54 dependent transcriptional regulator [Thermoanaerobaculia bacterium]